MMEYKGYVGKAEIDDEAGILYGTVLNIQDVITFQGATVDEARKAFHDSVDDYLAFCAELGKEPNKTFSGQFITRVAPELHKRLNIAAALANKSLNAIVTECLEAGLSKLFPGKPANHDRPVKTSRSPKPKKHSLHRHSKRQVSE